MFQLTQNPESGEFYLGIDNPALYRGNCYRAAGWEEAGETRGYARRRGGWEEHGCRKRVFVKPLAKAARTALSGGAEPSEWGCSAGRAPPPGRMRSLYDFLRSVPDHRSARGVRHRLATVLAVALASKLAGVRGVTAIAEFADRLTQAQLVAVRARLSPSTGRRVPPSRTSFHRILSELDPDKLERALREWAALGGTPGAPVAVDGKSAPGWVQGPSGDRMLDDIRGLDWAAAPAVSTTDKGHGRIEVRRDRAVAITAPPADCADLPGRRQAFCVERERTLLATGETTLETTHGITSLPPERAGAGTAGAQPRALGDREPAALGARLHLRRGPLPRQVG